MKLTDESKAFYSAAYTIINQVPYGHITSYGHIAYLLGKPQNSRQVGSSLKHYKEIIRQLNESISSPNDIVDFESLPWWRVVGSSGKISKRGNTQEEIDQKRLLVQEGVEVNGLQIDSDQYGWFPDDVEF